MVASLVWAARSALPPARCTRVDLSGPSNWPVSNIWSQATARSEAELYFSGSQFRGQPAVLTADFIRQQQELHLRGSDVGRGGRTGEAFPQRGVDFQLGRAAKDGPARLDACDGDLAAVGHRRFQTQNHQEDQLYIAAGQVA